MIKFAVRDIPSKGLHISQSVSKESIGLTDEEVDISSLLTVTADVKRMENAVFATTHLEANFGFMCSRCLEMFQEQQVRDYEFSIEIDPAVEYIDLGEEIRQEIIMENPTRILCKDDCKGICSGCGINLNLEQCQCKK